MKEEHVWKVGDRVTHRALDKFGTLLYHMRDKATWKVAKDDGSVTAWYEENLLPEPPMEALARTLQEKA